MFFVDFVNERLPTPDSGRVVNEWHVVSGCPSKHGCLCLVSDGVALRRWSIIFKNHTGLVTWYFRLLQRSRYWWKTDARFFLAYYPEPKKLETSLRASHLQWVGKSPCRKLSEWLWRRCILFFVMIVSLECGFSLVWTIVDQENSRIYFLCIILNFACHV